MTETKSDSKCRQIMLSGCGNTSLFEVEECEVLFPEANQVRVRVKACGLNFVDIYTRHGVFPGLPKPPCVLGFECAGEVEYVGSDVTNLKVGQKVACHSPMGGLWADLVCVPAERCYPMPKKMSFEDGAAIIINYLTAYLAVYDYGHLRSGQTVFIHSVTGGVGCAVTQLAKLLPGVKVIGTASQGKHEAAKTNGVDLVFTYEDYREKLTQNCPQGIDIFIDTLSGSDFTNARRHIKTMGKLIHVGAMNAINGWWALLRTWWNLKKISVVDLVFANHAVCGLNINNIQENDPTYFRRGVEHLFALYEKGDIKPKIDTVWTFDEVAEANEQMEGRKNVGKVILVPHKNDDKAKK